MELVFSSAFRPITGRARISITITGPMSIRDIISQAAKQCRELGKYTLIEDDNILLAQMNFVRKGQILKATDRVNDGDTIKVFLPVSGG